MNSFLNLQNRNKMVKGIKDIDAYAQKLMKQHKKEEIFKVGEKHLYFNKKSALVTAGGDEGKVEQITLEKTPVKEQPKEEDELENPDTNNKTATEDTSTPLSVTNEKKEDKPKNAKK